MTKKILFLALLAFAPVQLMQARVEVGQRAFKKAKITKSTTKKEKTQRTDLEWAHAEEKAQNTVVQVFAQHALFNWQDPYKAPEQQQGCGTGFFINNTGDLLTNFHVISQAKSAQISIPALGKELLDVSIVGVCPEADVALLRLAPKAVKKIQKILGKIPYLELGDSDALYATEPVLALGYPLGFRYLKSTVGVIAGRECLNGKSYMHITAPINPGNSGGPLLNDKGLVVGINSAGIPGAQNIGYIIPINDVKTILEDLYKKRLLFKPMLGINGNATTEEHALLLGNPLPTGLFINMVLKDSTAEKAGIKPGDVLYGIFDHNEYYPVDQYGDVKVEWRSSGKVSLDEFLVRFPLGSELKLVLYRAGKKITCTCLLNEQALYPVREIYPDYESQEINYELFGGLCIMTLRFNHAQMFANKAQVQEYMRPEKQHKQVLVITRILPGSCFAKTNSLHEGSLIDTINNKRVRTLADVAQALEESLNTGRIAVKTKDNISTVVSLDKVLQDEIRLSKAYMFTPSATVKKLEKLRKNQR